MDNAQQLAVGEEFSSRLLFFPIAEGSEVWPDDVSVELSWPERPNEQDLYLAEVGGLVAAFHSSDAPPQGRTRGTLNDAWYWYTPVPNTSGEITRVRVASCEMSRLAPEGPFFGAAPGTGQLRDVEQSPRTFKHGTDQGGRFVTETGVVIDLRIADAD
jgi:hypothetical protein